MSYRYIVLFVFVVMSCISMNAGCRIERSVMPCKLLHGITEREYSICLPESYNTDDERTYPVLYLLHGGGCHHTEWEEKGRLKAIVDSLVSRKEMEEMIIVCPEACKDNMIWLNASHWKFEDYFFQELIPYIENHYKAKTEKRYRGVAGFSMGGGAAVVYGLHHPEMFNIVFNMSGYLRRQPLDFLENDSTAEWRQRLVEDNSPIATIANGTRQQVKNWKTVQWFIDCGDKDFTLESNMDLVKAMRKQGVDYQMRIREGAHDWNYWHTSLEMLLKHFTKNIYKWKIVDNGGSGDYPAMALTESSLPNHVVYRPQNIQYAYMTEGRLPVLVFANGGCNDTSITHERALNEIASQGYIVIALGAMQMRLDDRVINKAPDALMYEAIDWIIAKNADPSSDYYHCIDTANIAIGGQSCGGAQVINVAADPRVKTYIMYNTGIGDMEMNGATQKKLTNFHAPVIYIIGDEEDVAYKNAIKDYERIDKVPVVFANLKNGGHMGTFAEQYGGSFAKIAIQWLDWHLKVRVSNSVVFLNQQLNNYQGWTIKTKKFKKIYQMTAYEIQDLKCNNKGNKIWGKIYVPKNVGKKVPLIVIGHGYNSSYRETLPYAEALAAHGMACCVFDFCGGSMNSKSGGKTTEMSVFSEQSDMEAIMNASRDWKFVDQSRLVLMGCSQGGLVASITAAANPHKVNSLILIYPALNIGYDAVNRHPKEAIHSEKFNLMGLDISHVYYDRLLKYNVFEDIKKIKNPVVTIYGDQDPITANDSMKKAAESFDKCEFKIISKGRHGFPDKKHLNKAINYTIDFAGKYILK